MSQAPKLPLPKRLGPAGPSKPPHTGPRLVLCHAIGGLHVHRKNNRGRARATLTLKVCASVLLHLSCHLLSTVPRSQAARHVDRHCPFPKDQPTCLARRATNNNAKRKEGPDPALPPVAFVLPCLSFPPFQAGFIDCRYI